MNLTGARPASVAPATDREHLGTVLFGLWMTVGLFLDGSFHQDLTEAEESFFTPWHAVFYSGFLATLLWLARLSLRRAAGSPDGFLRHLPPGHGGARAGIVVFGLGGVGDALWHSRYGVEKGIDALLSPTHLLLFAGLALLLAVPMQAALAGHPPAPWLQVGSLTAVTALVGFFLNFVWGLGIAVQARTTYDPVTEVGEQAVIAGVGSMLVTTVVLLVAADRLRRIDPVPAGAGLVLLVSVAALVSAAFDEDAEGVAAVLAAAVVLELSWRRGVAPRVSLAATAAVLWLAYFALLSGLDGIAWPAEIWLGACVLCTLVGVVIGSSAPRVGPPCQRVPGERAVNPLR